MSRAADLRVQINEKDTYRFTATLKDEDGTVIPLASLTTLTVSLYRKADPTIFVNSRNAQDCKNANDGTFHATSGLFTHLFKVLDSTFQSGVTASMDSHCALFIWTYNSGAKRNSYLLELQIQSQPVDA